MTPIPIPLDDQLELAPDFPADAEWINTSEPVQLFSLRGKFVLLDFWTYG